VAEVSRKLTELKLGDIEPEIIVVDPKPGEPLPDLSKLPYSVPELITFDAYHETFMSKILGGHCYLGIEKIVKINGKWALKFFLRANSAKWYDWIIIIKEDIEGYFDLETGKTLYLSIKKREGSYRQEKTVLFDYPNKRIVEKDVTKNSTTYRQFSLDETVVDSYSILFLIRRKNLNTEKNIFYKIYSNGKVYDLKTKVLGPKKIHMKKLDYDTNRVEVLTKVEGALEQKKGIFMHYTTGRKQYPLMTEADVKVGRFTLEMVKVE